MVVSDSMLKSLDEPDIADMVQMRLKVRLFDVEESILIIVRSSALRMISAGTPLNWRKGVIEPYMRFSTILHRSSAALAGIAHPCFRQISNIARKIRPADC